MLIRGGVILVACVALCVCLSVLAPAEDGPLQTDPALRELLEQRREVLLERAQIFESDLRTGLASIDSVIAAKNDLLSADLELAQSRADRIRIREEMLEYARVLEDRALSRFEAGHVNRHDVLSSKAERLQAEVNLLRERQHSNDR